jgi:hypothetical protein
MSPAKELHICTRYLVVAMLLTLKQSVCVHSEHQNLGITVETPDLPIISRELHNHGTYMIDWVVLANCRLSTPLVITLSLCWLHDQSTTNPEV